MKTQPVYRANAADQLWLVRNAVGEKLSAIGTRRAISAFEPKARHALTLWTTLLLQLGRIAASAWAT